MSMASPIPPPLSEQEMDKMTVAPEYRDAETQERFIARLRYLETQHAEQAVEDSLTSAAPSTERVEQRNGAYLDWQKRLAATCDAQPTGAPCLQCRESSDMHSAKFALLATRARLQAATELLKGLEAIADTEKPETPFSRCVLSRVRAFLKGQQ